MNGQWIFRAALILSLVFHGVLLARQQNWFGAEETRIVRIPVILEEAPTPEPPPPPPKPKRKPKNMRDEVTEVVQSEGLRAGELTTAEVGHYEPGPPKPPLIDRKKLLREYLGKVRAQLVARKVYPFAAQRMNITGVVKVSFSISANGNFGGVGIKRSSGKSILDNAAIGTVRGLSGKVKRPAALGPDPIRTSITFRYQLN